MGFDREAGEVWVTDPETRQHALNVYGMPGSVFAAVIKAVIRAVERD